MKKSSPSVVTVLPYADLIGCTKNFQFNDVPNEALLIALKEKSTEQRYAIIKELVKRTKGLSLFDTQLSAAYSLQHGRIAELPTGEGKTLSAVVAAVCYALDGHRVHLLVFNDYLAKRDFMTNEELYRLCEVSVGYIDQHSSPAQRRAAYACDVTYVSAKEAGFDYLRDFLSMDMGDIVFPRFDVAIVDEADSILIDEGRTPMVLAGEMPREKDRVIEIDRCVAKLRAADVGVNTIEHQAWLTETGIDRIEAMLKMNIYAEENAEILACVLNSLEARYLLQRDVDYIVKDGAVRIVESTTGRVIQNKRYPDLLHRAVEAKENVDPAPQTILYNSLTMQNFLLQYPTLCGMTGTIATSAREVGDSYGLQVDVIGPHTPCIRIDQPDIICPHASDHSNAIVQQIRQAHINKQPILAGTQSVAESEELSRLLAEAGIAHVVLNAKNDEAEAELIARAGEPGRVTISTNMAGRGVDIKLGGSDESQRETAVAAGGLLVIGTGINPCVRIDNQLRGRAGRQGDPGESRFIICLENNDLTSRMSAFQRVRAEYGKEAYQQNIVRRIQKQLDGEAAEARYMLKRYASVLEEQRCIVSKWRNEVLSGERYMAYLESHNPQKYDALCTAAGTYGVKRAEQQLTLYHIIQNWANHLTLMDEIRESIHLMVIARKDPLVEYYRAAIDSYEQMMGDIQNAVLEGMATLPITKDGIDMEKAGLGGGTTTWTYDIDDSANQFNALRAVMRRAREKLTGDDGVLTELYRQWKGAKM